MSDWYDRILALEYMDQYFGDYLGESEDHALAYELEYVLAGKGSDKENLKASSSACCLSGRPPISRISSEMGTSGQRRLNGGGAGGIYGKSCGCAACPDGGNRGVGVCGEYFGHPGIAGGDKIALIKTETQWTAQFGSLAAAFEDGKRQKTAKTV